MGAERLIDYTLPWEILEAAYFCFRRKGFDRTSISDVCQRLGISTSVFHVYFDSLDEVLDILWSR